MVVRVTADKRARLFLSEITTLSHKSALNRFLLASIGPEAVGDGFRTIQQHGSFIFLGFLELRHAHSGLIEGFFQPLRVVFEIVEFILANPR